jgi:hypothetical protein
MSTITFSLPSNSISPQTQNQIFHFSLVDSTDATATEQNKQTETPESCNDNQIKIINFVFSRKNFILAVITTICVFLGIVLLFFIYSQLQVKQGDYRPSISDGDDSRKNIAIISTIGNESSFEN